MDGTKVSISATTVDVLLTENEKSRLVNLFAAEADSAKIRISIDKAIRLVENDVKVAKKDYRGRFIPSFKKFDIVHCYFTGVGFEWDLPHYAVVWNVDPILDAVEVIPLTSALRDDHPDVIFLNKITGLPKKKQTTLLLSDKTRVSRKRLVPVEFTHPKHGLKKVVVPKSWESRIVHGIIATNTHCKTLEEIVSNECGLAMIGKLSIHKELKFKAVQDYSFDESTCILSYRQWDKINFEQLQLVGPAVVNTTSKDIKVKKIKWLNSRHEALRSLAAQYFKEIYNILV